MTNNDTAKPVTKPTRKMARELKAGQAAEPSPKRPSKSAAALAMLQRPEGATLDQLVIATGWLSVRSCTRGRSILASMKPSSTAGSSMRSRTAWRLAPTRRLSRVGAARSAYWPG